MLACSHQERRLLAAALAMLLAVGCFLLAVVTILTGQDWGAYALPLAPVATLAGILLLPQL